jgi:hypothetical protein
MGRVRRGRVRWGWVEWASSDRLNWDWSVGDGLGSEGRMGWVGTGRLVTGLLGRGRSGTSRSRKKLPRTLLLLTGLKRVFRMYRSFLS